jgi:predicted nucleic acid-binding protein
MTEKVYLDTSVYNRPFDEQKQARIWLETLAFSVILQLLETQDLELITSSILAYETSRNPHRQRREWVNRIAQMSSSHQMVNDAIRERANSLASSNIKPLDALHIACPETAAADYFVTCDDYLIRRYPSAADTKMTICNPPDFVRLVTGEKP